MSTNNIGFHEDLTKISFNNHYISSTTHLISSSGLMSLLLSAPNINGRYAIESPTLESQLRLFKRAPSICMQTNIRHRIDRFNRNHVLHVI